VRLVSIWQNRWEDVGEQRIPTVPPSAVNEEVLAYLSAHGQPERMVVHYIQPHAPYIGRRALPLARIGRWGPAFRHGRGRLSPPEEAIRSGDVTRQDVQEAYADNLALVWDAARALAAELKGEIVVTSDHGELLGEGGQFGHSCRSHAEALRRVPWLRMSNGAFAPSPVADILDGDDAGIQERLRDLGYM
jgi:hypothetical protein